MQLKSQSHCSLLFHSKCKHVNAKSQRCILKFYSQMSDLLTKVLTTNPQGILYINCMFIFSTLLFI